MSGAATSYSSCCQAFRWLNPLTSYEIRHNSRLHDFRALHGKTGGINVIDLANIHSCAFIATQDLGRVYTDQTFEVLGRFEQSDIRGCNLLVQ